MLELLDAGHEPFVEKDAVLPPVGEYYALITNFDTVGSFLEDDYCTTLIIDYLLISLDEKNTYRFTETYIPSWNNPRYTELYRSLNRYFTEDEIDCINEDIINFAVERVTLDWEFLGGQAYPIITNRELISRQPAEEDIEDVLIPLIKN